MGEEGGSELSSTQGGIRDSGAGVRSRGARGSGTVRWEKALENQSTPFRGSRGNRGTSQSRGSPRPQGRCVGHAGRGTFAVAARAAPDPRAPSPRGLRTRARPSASPASAEEVPGLGRGGPGPVTCAAPRRPCPARRGDARLGAGPRVTTRRARPAPPRLRFAPARGRRLPRSRVLPARPPAVGALVSARSASAAPPLHVAMDRGPRAPPPCPARQLPRRGGTARCAPRGSSRGVLSSGDAFGSPGPAPSNAGNPC